MKKIIHSFQSLLFVQKYYPVTIILLINVYIYYFYNVILKYNYDFKTHYMIKYSKLIIKSHKENYFLIQFFA